MQHYTQFTPISFQNFSLLVLWGKVKCFIKYINYLYIFLIAPISITIAFHSWVRFHEGSDDGPWCLLLCLDPLHSLVLDTYLLRSRFRKCVYDFVQPFRLVKQRNRTMPIVNKLWLITTIH